MGKVSERLAIADRVGLELQNRYSYEEIDIYLEAFGLPTPAGHQNEYYDRRDYAKSVLSKSSISVLAEMVDDLGIESFMSIVTKAVTPNIWKDDGKLRVFVSHLSSEKHKAMRIRDALAAYGMSAFVAHEDIEPTLEWQVQIERRCTRWSCLSRYIHQNSETAFGHSRKLASRSAVVSKSLQCEWARIRSDLSRSIKRYREGVKKAEEIASDIDELILKDERLRSRYEQCKIDDDLPF